MRAEGSRRASGAAVSIARIPAAPPAKTATKVATEWTVARRVFIFTLFVFCISPVSVLSDGQYSLLLSESILRHHSLHLDAYSFPEPVPHDVPCGQQSAGDAYISNEYELNRIGASVVYCYPGGTSILSLPFVAVMGAIGIRPAAPDGRYNYVGEAMLQRLLAAILMAGFSCVVFITSRLILDTATSLLITFGTAFGTQVWSTASRTLWSHTWFIFLGSFVVYFILRCEKKTATLHPVLLATLLSWMYFVRPTAVVPIVCVTLYVFACRPRDLPAFATTGAGWLAGFITYSWFCFGRLIPEYYVNFHSNWREFPLALAGTLISPSRGLFVFVPIAGYVLYLAARYQRNMPCKSAAVLALAVIGLQIVVIGSWHFWWGGYSYGPRLLTDLVPWFALLAILGLKARTASSIAGPRRVEAAIGLAVLGISVLINARGAISWSTFNWNNVVDIDFHPDRAFEWKYPQFLAGLIPEPRYKTRHENR